MDEFRSDGTHAIMSSQRHILAVTDPIFDHYGGQLQCFSFDRQTGALYLADVGQDAWEEVDYRARGNYNANFGWSRYEGNHDYNTGMAVQGPFPPVFPVAEYSHSQGCAIMGGYVYRGFLVSAARGRYFYADFCNGTFWSFLLVSGHVTGLRTESFHVNNPTSFGQDSRGELYVVNLAGQVFKLSPF